MSRITTVSLELLRHGPAHNQLLSPLTRYLALCGNHSAVSVSVPYEHQQVLGRLRTLQYRGGGTLNDPDTRTTREIQTQEMAASMGELLGGIRPLLAELVGAPEEDDPLLHLELVLSASELSLLPFEIAATPEGFPGAGRSLLLQDQLPICLTRRVRRVDNRHFQWPQPPRILFAVASPPGVGPVPVEAHLLALRRAVDPWLKHRDGELAKHLEVLTDASIESLAATCHSGDFSHVHLLAHGVPTSIAGDAKFGIALHGRDPRQLSVVDGRRLAIALVGKNRGAPAVVTIASCDSGNVGSVISDGASVAHALHEAGIPLVVGSQLPLSFPGSVLMVEALYNCLLKGRDPRLALVDLRRRLFAEVPDTHDWASLVAYTALPADFDAQLSDAEIFQTRRRIDATLSHVDAALGDKADAQPNVRLDTMDALLRRLSSDCQRLRRLLPSATAAREHDAKRRQRAVVAGLLGSVDKRDAQVAHRAARLNALGTDPAARARSLERRVRRSLSTSYEDYSIVVRTDLGQTWALVQVLSLGLVLDRNRESWLDLWTAARVASEAQLASDDDQQVRWALSALAELWTLGPTIPGFLEPERARERALHYTEALTRHPERRWIDLLAAQHQVARFSEFFAEVDGSRFGEKDDAGVRTTREIAAVVAARLQKTRDEDPYFV